ncbi:Succinyl-diaminopimelate desuccinylase [Fusarium oxysporum f. sp. albedinis]|nr:Succinyl-diaminopimelate desuccinylase [Fusarium oxysporum f. sp. albedinis]
MSMTRGEMFFSVKLEGANRESTSPPGASRTPDTFLVQTFREYLRGHAVQWFEEEGLGDKTFEKIIPLFEEKFSGPKTAEDGALIAEAP